MPTPTILETVVSEINPPINACVIWLHGLGADGHDFADIVFQLQLPPSLGIRFIFPHAPIRAVTINNGFKMRAWYDIYALDNLSREDQAGIEASQQAVGALIDQQIKAGIPASRIVLGGFSQGGALALYTGIRYSHRLAGIFGLSTYLPLIQFLSSAHGVNQTTPILMAHGHYDNILPMTLGEKSRDILRQASYQVEWRHYPMSHEVCQQEINDVSQWLLSIL